MTGPACACGRRHGLGRRGFIVLAGGAAAAACTGADLAGLGLVPDQEIERMGEATWRRTLAEQRVSRDPQARARVERVVRRIVDRNGLGGNWELAVFEDPSPNAFALPGGRIGVNTGLLGIAPTDDELATVVGHEIGHVTAEHSAQRVNAQAASQAGAQVLGVALGAMLGGGGGAGQGDLIAGLLGAGANFGLVLPFSRDQELEADAIGVRYMDRAGYDPAAALSFWQRMSQASARGAPPEWMSTHPSDARRMEQLRALVAQASG